MPVFSDKIRFVHEFIHQLLEHFYLSDDDDGCEYGVQYNESEDVTDSNKDRLCDVQFQQATASAFHAEVSHCKDAGTTELPFNDGSRDVATLPENEPFAPEE